LKNQPLADLKVQEKENMEEEREIISRVLAGDRKAFEFIVNRYKNPVMKIVFRSTGNYDASLDITQETFFKAWKYLKSYRPDMRFSSWIFKIATNLARDYNKTCKESLNGEEILMEHITLKYETENYSPDNEIYIRSLLQKLDEPYRTAIILRYIRDLNYDEIANIMEVNPGQVKNYLFRGRKYLLNLAGEEEYNEK